MIEAKLIPNKPTYHLIDRDGNDLEVPIYIGKTKSTVKIIKDLTLGDACDVSSQYGVNIVNLEDYKKDEKEKLIDRLKKLINNLRDMRSKELESDTFPEEQLYYLNVGYKEGLCSAAMVLADEIDAELEEIISGESYIEKEEDWWACDEDQMKINERL